MHIENIIEASKEPLFYSLSFDQISIIIKKKSNFPMKTILLEKS